MLFHKEICCNIHQLLVSTRDSKSFSIISEQWQASICNWVILRPVLEKHLQNVLFQEYRPNIIWGNCRLPTVATISITIMFAVSQQPILWSKSLPPHVLVLPLSETHEERFLEQRVKFLKLQVQFGLCFLM